MRLPEALRALKRRDLRLFFAGQAVSLVGTWMQSVAQGWLLFRLTGSPALLGLLGFLGQVPVFLFAAWGGSLADRMPRRALAIATQVAAMLQAGSLAYLTLAGVIEGWHVLVLASVLGMISALDIPCRQAYLTDMAADELQNAIAINSTLVNATRIVGPAIGGYVVALTGEGVCFLLNALSYLSVIAALAATRTESPRTGLTARGHFAEGLRYAARTPHARALLLLVGAGSLFGMPYVVLLPVFAGEVFEGGPELLGRLFGAAGLGALFGSVALLRLRELDGLWRRVAYGSTLFALGIIGLSRAPGPALAQVALFCSGFGFILQLGGSNTLVQALSPPALRGRVMGLFSTMFIGMMPFGSLAVGALAAWAGPRDAVLSGAVALLAASAVFHWAMPGLRRRVRAEFEERFVARAP